MFSKGTSFSGKGVYWNSQRLPKCDIRWWYELGWQFGRCFPSKWWVRGCLDGAEAWRNGWTYDTKANQMLSGNHTLPKRLDRFLWRLRDFKINSIEMIGNEAIPGPSYCKEKKVRKEGKKLQLPVLRSDHYGLLLQSRGVPVTSFLCDLVRSILCEYQ